jgi:glycosyltransferase involved in cell wall biosynthesis
VDLQVIGPFGKASGLGQACRLAGDIATATRYSANLVDFGMDNPAHEGFSTKALVSSLRDARVNLIHLNAESVPLAFAYLPDVFTGRYNIGFFYWELDSPAACHTLAMQILDEIWVASEFGVASYQPHTRIPVTNVGVAFEAVPEIRREDARALLRTRYGIRDTTFVFIATFDSFSFTTRKNPIGTIKAFQAAFEGGEDVMLILKTQNRSRLEHRGQVSEAKAIEEVAAGDPRVLLIDQTLDYLDLLSLKRGCDAYVSLHRSEGWGFGPIEAMALGVPVICTAYSGNMEYCNDATAWLVDYELVAVPEEDYVFVIPGQRWADPSIPSAVLAIRECFEEEEKRIEKARAALEFVNREFSVSSIAKRYEARLDKIFEVVG